MPKRQILTLGFPGQLWLTKSKILENMKDDGILPSWNIKIKKSLDFDHFEKIGNFSKYQNTWSFRKLSKVVNSSSSIQFEQTRALIQDHIWYYHMEKY